MSGKCSVAVLSGLIVLGATTAAAQGRTTLVVSARVENVEPSRKSLQAATDLVRSAGQLGHSEALSSRRVTAYGAVTQRTVRGDPYQASKLITTIVFW